MTATATAAATDSTALTADDALAPGPPGFELLIVPVLAPPAEQELVVVTT